MTVIKKGVDEHMVIILVFVALFLIVNLPIYTRKYLTQSIANYCARKQGQGVQINCLSRIEWLRLYPLKKVCLVLLWGICLWIAVGGTILTIRDSRRTYVLLTAIFWIITLTSLYPLWKYICLPYHCAVVLNKTQSKQELKAALQGECFEKVNFEHKSLSRDFYVLMSKNWVVIDGYMIPRHGIEKIYYLHEPPFVRHEQIQFVFSNGETFFLHSDGSPDNELRQKEIANLLHQICPLVIEKEKDDPQASMRKDQALLYHRMNYKGKFRRTLWFVPAVIALNILMPICFGKIWILYDLFMIGVLVWQLFYTYKMKGIEEKMQTGEYKICPYCKRLVLKQETFCSHCHHDVHEGPTSLDQQEQQDENKQ